MVEAWEGEGCGEKLRRALVCQVRVVRAVRVVLGWLAEDPDCWNAVRRRHGDDSRRLFVEALQSLASRVSVLPRSVYCELDQRTILSVAVMLRSRWMETVAMVDQCWWHVSSNYMLYLMYNTVRSRSRLAFSDAAVGYCCSGRGSIPPKSSSRL